jgi:hypothetical protein
LSSHTQGNQTLITFNTKVTDRNRRTRPVYLSIFTAPQIVAMTPSHIQADQQLKIRLEGKGDGGAYSTRACRKMAHSHTLHVGVVLPVLEPFVSLLSFKTPNTAQPLGSGTATRYWPPHVRHGTCPSGTGHYTCDRELVHLVLATTRAIWNLSIWYWPPSGTGHHKCDMELVHLVLATTSAIGNLSIWYWPPQVRYGTCPSGTGHHTCDMELVHLVF